VVDLAWDWRLPTVLVVPVKLGAIGQAVANVALARMSRVHLKGIVLNCVQPCSAEDIANWAPANLIQSLTSIPILGLIPHLTDPTDLEKLAQVASNLELERLIPLTW
jgi:dethiobiotin synthetase